MVGWMIWIRRIRKVWNWKMVGRDLLLISRVEKRDKFGNYKMMIG